MTLAGCPEITVEDFTAETAMGPRAARWVRPASAQAGDSPIVLLHEGLGSIAQWKDFPERLARATGHAVLVYDRQGYGKSPALTETRGIRYLHDYALMELPAVLEACGVEAPPILFGHSDGGSVALLYAAHLPTRALITEAAHVFVEDISVAGIRDARHAWKTTDLAARLAKYHGAKTEQIFFAWADTWMTDWFRDWNIEADIQAITCPSLILQGEDDEYGTAAQVRAIVNRIGPSAQGNLIPDCRHIPHFQAGEVVLGATQRFLEDIR
ncbi:alpha/beta fold hydrolase [Aestuariispira ectoiniformans]|uniref:alpha/beta fold hydrolase n=1 Tax=Aestuariispira ectoiniformans TaxID=2775080 RepID=UPI00223B8F5E|nr:alpha/beta hydrolase [Aestuariispira ectoiniformans]